MQKHESNCFTIKSEFTFLFWAIITQRSLGNPTQNPRRNQHTEPQGISKITNILPLQGIWPSTQLVSSVFAEFQTTKGGKKAEQEFCHSRFFPNCHFVCPLEGHLIPSPISNPIELATMEGDNSDNPEITEFTSVEVKMENLDALEESLKNKKREKLHGTMNHTTQSNCMVQAMAPNR